MCSCFQNICAYQRLVSSEMKLQNLYYLNGKETNYSILLKELKSAEPHLPPEHNNLVNIVIDSEPGISETSSTVSSLNDLSSDSSTLSDCEENSFDFGIWGSQASTLSEVYTSALTVSNSEESNSRLTIGDTIPLVHSEEKITWDFGNYHVQGEDLNVLISHFHKSKQVLEEHSYCKR